MARSSLLLAEWGCSDQLCHPDQSRSLKTLICGVDVSSPGCQGALAGLGAFMDSFRLADHSGVIASYLESDVGGLPQWVMQMWAG
jgi:hypothetical protein